ncbi:hypothetical protein RMHFA_05702 [Roseomonas mucosa]|nr:hypothetical protein RMHFA_05702 [Roseomonas mucosa]
MRFAAWRRAVPGGRGSAFFPRPPSARTLHRTIAKSSSSRPNKSRLNTHAEDGWDGIIFLLPVGFSSRILW